MAKRGKHATGWQDEQMASLVCEGVHTDQILSLDHDQPETCERCGAQVRLVWNVYVEEIGSTIVSERVEDLPTNFHKPEGA